MIFENQQIRVRRVTAIGCLAGALTGGVIGNYFGYNRGFNQGVKIGTTEGKESAKPVSAGYRTIGGTKTNAIEIYSANGNWILLVKNPVKAEYGMQGEISRGALEDFITIEEAKRIEMQELEYRASQEQSRLQVKTGERLRDLAKRLNVEQAELNEKYQTISKLNGESQ